jgi:putative membrane protein
MLEHHVLHLAGHVVLFGTATLMWWPVISPLPEMPTLSYPGRMFYLFLQSIVPTVPASFLTFADAPIYKLYETFPRLWGIGVLVDQQMAGLIMKIGGGLLLWVVIATIFFRWSSQEQSGVVETVSWDDFEHELEAYKLRK